MFKECLEIRWKIAHFCQPRPRPPARFSHALEVFASLISLSKIIFV